MRQQKRFTFYSHVPLYATQIAQHLQQDYTTINNRKIYMYSLLV